MNVLPCITTLVPLALCAAPATLPWSVHGPLTVSETHHYLVHRDGTPFVWLGDTAWVLHENLSREDAITYLDDAAAKSFTIIQLMSVNGWALNDQRNYYGDAPYIDDKPWQLNPPYWKHLAWVIDQAAQRGLYVLLVYGSPGRKDEKVPFVHTPAEAYRYGRAIGAFLGDKPNLIWGGGIDVNPDSKRSVSDMGFDGWPAMAEGVADGVNGEDAFDGRADYGTTLMTYHPSGGSITTTWFRDAPWLDFDGAQIGLSGDDIVSKLRAAWELPDPKPVVNLEPWYEGCTWKSPPVNDWECRAEAYQSLFAGACGYTYGGDLVYAFDSPGDEFGRRWREGLDAPGRCQMRHVRELLESRPILEREPNLPIVVASDGGGHESGLPTERIAASGCLNAGWAWVYSPQGRSFTVDTARFAPRPPRAAWFDPRTGERRPAGPVPTEDEIEFDPPGEPGPGNDWVLILGQRR